MDNDKMLHQLNEIAAYFEVYPQQRGRDGVLEHIRKFWPPRMRKQLGAYRAAGGEGLHPLAAWAADQLDETRAEA